MQVIIDFFEYTLDGGLGLAYTIAMIIFSLACLGVVGEKVSKKKHEELIAKREALAKEESNKAKELVKKQAESYGVSNTLDPTAVKKVEEPVAAVVETPVVESSVSENVASVNNEVALPEVSPDVKPSDEVVIFDAPVEQNANQVVDNITPIVDNLSEEAVKVDEDIPSVLVINEDGTSNVSV